MFLSQDEPAFEAVCAAVAINRPDMSLREVEQAAAALAGDRRVAYAALCVSCGSEPQEKLTTLVQHVLTHQEAVS
jgi:hypothetical protein